MSSEKSVPPAYAPPAGPGVATAPGPSIGQQQYPQQQQQQYMTPQYQTGGPPYVNQPGGQPGAYYAPPPPGGVYNVGGGQNTVIVTTPTVVVQRNGIFGDSPLTTTCPSCMNNITTSVTHEVGAMTWIIFAVLCILGCWLCAFIPFCVPSCKDAVHSCPNCRAVIGRHSRV